MTQGSKGLFRKAKPADAMLSKARLAPSTWSAAEQLVMDDDGEPRTRLSVHVPALSTAAALLA